MSTLSAEHRAKIAASLRRYFEQHPEARQRSAEAGRRGANKTNSLKAAELAELEGLRAELARLRGGDPR